MSPAVTVTVAGENELSAMVTSGVAAIAVPASESAAAIAPAATIRRIGREGMRSSSRGAPVGEQGARARVRDERHARACTAVCNPPERGLGLRT